MILSKWQKNSKGNQSTRPSTEKLFKTPLYNEINLSSKRSSSIAKRTSSNGTIKNLKLEEQKYCEQDNVLLNKYSNSNTNLLKSPFTQAGTNRSNSISASTSNVNSNYTKNRESSQSTRGHTTNTNSTKNLSLLIQTDYKNKVRSPSNRSNLLVSQILKERPNYESTKNSNQMRLNVYN